MSENFKTLVIVNPASANGRTRRLWPKIYRSLQASLAEFEYKFTTTPDEATQITSRAIQDGFEMIVAVGGDGTNNEVVNGFFTAGEPINPAAVFGTISCGTGSDLIKTLSIPKNYQQAVKILEGKATRRVDLGKITFIDHQGAQRERYFINIGDFGLGGETVARVNRTTKAFGGKLSFLWGTLATIFRYRKKMVRIKVDKKYDKEKRITAVVVANGRFFGGGILITPAAEMDDGLFDVLIIGDIGWGEIIRNLQYLYRSVDKERALERIQAHPELDFLRGKTVTAHSPEKVFIDLDGEQPGFLPASFELLPGSLLIKIPVGPGKG